MVSEGWTFLSNHGHVLVLLARAPDLRIRDVAGQVQKILSDLGAAGYVVTHREGRRNHYEIVRDAHLRHTLEAEVLVGDLADLVSTAAAGRAPHVEQ